MILLCYSMLPSWLVADLHCLFLLLQLSQSTFLSFLLMFSGFPWTPVLSIDMNMFLFPLLYFVQPLHLNLHVDLLCKVWKVVCAECEAWFCKVWMGHGLCKLQN